MRANGGKFIERVVEYENFVGPSLASFPADEAAVQRNIAVPSPIF